MIKAHQIKLYPTEDQEALLRKSCGVARFAFNWALAKWKEDYKNGVKQSAYSVIKYLNSIKRVEFPWMQETSKTCSQYAIHNVETAFKKMWKENTGYPNFKKKGTKEGFVAVENFKHFNQSNYKIHIPRIGKIRCAENLRFKGKVNNVVVKRKANMWFATINISVSESIPPTIKKNTSGDNQAVVGIDMGIKSLMSLSDGTVYENPKALKSNLKQLKRIQKRFSSKEKGSKNREKHKIKIARKHYRIANIRKNAINQATSEITKKYDKIIIEDLNTKGMMKNRKLSQAIFDASFGMIVRQLTYKAQWNGVELIKANRFFASSKICSSCGYKKNKLKLHERTYKCFNCGLELDRDCNAAKNLANYGSTLKCGGTNASGFGSSANASLHSLKMKEEIHILSTK